MNENKTKTIKSLKEMEDDLNKKLNQELYNFKEELLETEPKNILDNAYKIVVMQEIMDYLLNDRTYTRTEINALLDGEDILQQCYDEWLSFDGNFREMLEYPTDRYVDMVSEEYHKEMEKKLSENQVANQTKSSPDIKVNENKETQNIEQITKKNDAR